MASDDQSELRQRPTGELLKELSDQTTSLVRQEMDLAMPLWLAALIVAVVYAAVAGVLALRAKGQIKKAVPPVPEQTQESVKEDVQWAKTRARSATK